MTSVLPNAYKSVKKAAAPQNASITTWAVMFVGLVEELITRLESLPSEASFLWIKVDNPLQCDNNARINVEARFKIKVLLGWRRGTCCWIVHNLVSHPPLRLLNWYEFYSMDEWLSLSWEKYPESYPLRERATQKWKTKMHFKVTRRVSG